MSLLVLWIIAGTTPLGSLEERECFADPFYLLCRFLIEEYA